MLSSGALQTRAAILERMIDLYRGPLLEGEDYLVWALEAREHLESLFLKANISLAAICMNRGEHSEAADGHQKADEERQRAEGLLTRALQWLAQRSGRTPSRESSLVASRNIIVDRPDADAYNYRRFL